MTGEQKGQAHMGLKEMREHYAQVDGPSRLLKQWQARCAAYYGHADITLVPQWQRDSYARVARDREPRR